MGDMRAAIEKGQFNDFYAQFKEDQARGDIPPLA